MAAKLFLIDGMALLYRAHFAFVRSPIMTSDGVNTSALYGFTNALVDILENHQATHLAAALDTRAPTARHTLFPAYKAQRDEMPEDLAAAIPQVKRMLKAFHIPLLELDGYEADDLIGTLARQAEEAGDIDCFMVTPDKDFAQLVAPHTHIFKPGRLNSPPEIIRLPQVLESWNVQSPEYVADILGLWGDASDNIPGVPGIGEKTAKQLVGQFGSLDALLAQTAQLKGKQRERLEEFADQARLSRDLATIDRHAPVSLDLDDFAISPRDVPALSAILSEFEFNSLGRRLLGPDFNAGRARQRQAQQAAHQPSPNDEIPSSTPADAQAEFAFADAPKTLADTRHHYHLIQPDDAAARQKLAAKLAKLPSFAFDLETTGLDPLSDTPLGIAFSFSPHDAYYVALPHGRDAARAALHDFSHLFSSSPAEKVGHNLKFDLSFLIANGIEPAGPFFDTMLVHALVEPGQRHGLDFLAEVYLNYTPIPLTKLIGERSTPEGQLPIDQIPLEQLAEYAAEDADVAWQLALALRKPLEDSAQGEVYREVEAPLLPVLARMELAGIALDPHALTAVSHELGTSIEQLRAHITDLAGHDFNINSRQQLGVVLFEELKLLDKPKKTRTGQYSTTEQVLQTLVGTHPIIQHILDYNTAHKLKGTYVDTLPDHVHPRSRRIHTRFHQLVAATGRLASSDPNLQNIPIRTDLGRQIRRAFVPGHPGWILLAADYSQIELRILASISGDEHMRQAFRDGIDIHAATAGLLYGLDPADVSSSMRRAAKMVNFGISYGITAFGLSQRLGVPRREASLLIDSYFQSYPGIKAYMDKTIEDARSKGYTTTLRGRRRHYRDIDSRNAALRSREEREAINSPIQGTAADMIKLAMIRVDQALHQAGLKCQMLLQVHDELVFELPPEELDQASHLIREAMITALPLPEIPIEVEIGTGQTWLEAH
jgi:DNA polymerase I